MSQTYPEYSLVAFPDSLDNFKQFMDIVSDDWQYITAYQNAVKNNDMQSAQQALNNIPSVDKKILSAIRFNELREAILALEKFYKGDIENYIINKQTEWEDRVNQFTYIGVYSPNTTYKRNNIVKYNDNGVDKLYINYNNTPITGISPTNTNYWYVLTVQGKRGIEGGEGTFQYGWNSSTSYGLGAIVVYNNVWWFATQANQNKPPMSGSLYWKQILNVNTAIYPIQAEEPVGQMTGELWFRLV